MEDVFGDLLHQRSIQSQFTPACHVSWKGSGNLIEEQDSIRGQAA